MSDEETQQGDAISTSVIDGKSSNKRGEVVGRLEFLDETGWLRCSSSAGRWGVVLTMAAIAVGKAAATESGARAGSLKNVASRAAVPAGQLATLWRRVWQS